LQIRQEYDNQKRALEAKISQDKVKFTRQYTQVVEEMEE